MAEVALSDLALIGDRRTAALVDQAGTIVRYCPRRFDEPALLTALLDAEKGGRWSFEPKMANSSRRYLGESGVLETVLSTPKGDLTPVEGPGSS